jgi:hypothetical protein
VGFSLVVTAHYPEDADQTAVHIESAGHYGVKRSFSRCVSVRVRGVK